MHWASVLALTLGMPTSCRVTRQTWHRLQSTSFALICVITFTWPDSFQIHLTHYHWSNLWKKLLVCRGYLLPQAEASSLGLNILTSLVSHGSSIHPLVWQTHLSLPLHASRSPPLCFWSCQPLCWNALPSGPNHHLLRPNFISSAWRIPNLLSSPFPLKTKTLIISFPEG